MRQLAVVVCDRPQPRSLETPTEEEFKEVMSHFAAAVGVAACWHGGRPAGLLISSLTPLSVDPPRILFCVLKSAGSHDAFMSADTCSVSLLRETDRDEAERFSSYGRHGERFDPGAWILEPQAPPLYRPAVIWLEGWLSRRLDAGTHSVFVLNVTRATAQGGRPLIYANRGYAGLRRLTDGALAG